MLFTITGLVIQRRKRGTSLGFPTANLALPVGISLQYGSYAGYVKLESQFYPAAIYYGPEQPPQIEAHVLDFSGDLYHQTITIQCLALLRLHQALTDKTQLIQTIQSDVNAVLPCLAALPKPL